MAPTATCARGHIGVWRFTARYAGGIEDVEVVAVRAVGRWGSTTKALSV